MQTESPNLPPEVWDLDAEEIDCDFNENEKVPYFEFASGGSDNCNILALSQWIILILYMWASFCSISSNAMEILLMFLRGLFDAFATVIPGIGRVASLIPKSVHLFRSKLGLNDDHFIKYVVCKSCNTLYCFEDCYIMRYGKTAIKQCDRIAFPHHRQPFRRTPCNEPLLKEVIMKNGKVRLYPFKVYCYNSIIASMQQFLKRPGFAAKCELWRERDTPSGILADVFDGRIWKEWQYIGVNKPFLASSHNYAFMLNVDWFQPFKHSLYSVGALYMVLMNLPRAERFRPENVFLVGIIPGPHEPKLNINSFLKPLVEELNILWNDGVNVKLPGNNESINVKAALLCVGCDVPATRKLCGFTAHPSRKGCSKCTKSFLGSVSDGIDYSGFEPEPPRNSNNVREQAQDVLNQTTATDQANKEKEYGVRFSELLLLPYFDPVRFHTIDPMHCLFTGTAKNVMHNIWLDEDKPLISKKDLAKIQSKVDKIKVPSSIGRMPRKVENCYGGFTADQWKSWTVLFSIYALWDVLPLSHLELWRHFVMACSLLSSPIVSEGRAELAHLHLLSFCKGFEELYGKHKVTPNMHLQTHILECIMDYGPVYSFWLFSFERYNGMIADVITNQKAVEIQLMRKFVSDLYVRDIVLPQKFVSYFQPVLDKLTNQAVGTLGTSLDEYPCSKKIINTTLLSIGPFRESNNWKAIRSDNLYQCCPPQYNGCFTFHLLIHLQDAYKIIFPGVKCDSVSRFFERFASVTWAGEQFGSSHSRRDRSSFITARWCGFGGQIDVSGSDLRPGVIDYFIRQAIIVSDESVTCILASVRWFQKHPQRHKIGSPTEIWCKNSFEPDGPANFIPIQRIYSRFVPAFESINREEVLVVCPIPRKLQC